MIYKQILRKLPIICCFLIWITSVLYSVVQFTLRTEKFFSKFHDYYDDFTLGWTFLKHRKRDKADFEWETFNYLINELYAISIFYLILFEILRYAKVSSKLEQFFQISYTIVCLTYKLGYRITAVILLQPIIFLLINKWKRTYLVWLCNILFLVLTTGYKHVSNKEEFQQYFKLNSDYKRHMVTLVLSWLNLKCTSFCLNETAKSKQPKNYLLGYFAYVLYFPTIFSGPFISFNDFKRKYDKKTIVKFYQRLKQLLLNVIRCLFWYFFINFLLHYIYAYATTFQVDMIKSLKLSSLCGYGYILGQFFHMKYLVFYGLSTSLASFDNVKVPKLPRCIARIHIYSDMWKYFDPGLHKFLKTYIFIPSKNRFYYKFVASFICFSFIFLWHGIEIDILIWTVMNFLGVFIEYLLNKFIYKKLEQKNVPHLRRIKCILAAPLLALSAISNFYFFTGKEVGDIFMERFLFEESRLNILVLMFILYCCCEVSTELKNVDSFQIS